MDISLLLVTGFLLGNLGSENSIVCLCNSEYEAGTVRGITWEEPAQPVTAAPMSKRDLVRKVVGYAGSIPVLGSAIQFIQRLENMAQGDNLKMKVDLDPFKKNYGVEFIYNFSVAKKEIK